MFRYFTIGAATLGLVFVTTLPLPADAPQPTPTVIHDAISKSLSLIEKSTAEYRQQRTCFSCHHQAMPVLTLAAAHQHGIAIDEENLQAQLRWTAEHLERGRQNYLEGQGQGGKADTAGYALWALEAGRWKPDETTAAVAHFLLAWHEDKDHWRRTSYRPPSEASDFTTTYLAVRALEAFATDEQAPRIAERKRQALEWIKLAKTEDLEDEVFRLRALSFLSADEDTVKAAADQLIGQQREDGGWAQTPDLESDAYATGTVLVTLHEYGLLTAEEDSHQRGVQFLIQDQLEDGSWHVASRSDPFQAYFESGFPHGKDQFISITASCWATLALIPAGTSQQ